MLLLPAYRIPGVKVQKSSQQEQDNHTDKAREMVGIDKGRKKREVRPAVDLKGIKPKQFVSLRELLDNAQKRNRKPENKNSANQERYLFLTFDKIQDQPE